MRQRLVCACLLALIAGAAVHTPIAAWGKRPDDRLWVSSVRAWLDQSDYASARRWLKAFLKESADPDAAYAYLYCLYESAAYRRLLALAQRERFAAVASQRRGRILIGLTLWRLGDTPRALQCWAAVLAENPRDDLAWECVRAAVLAVSRHQRTSLVLAFSRTLDYSGLATALLPGLLESLRGRTSQAEKRLHKAHLLFPESKTVVLALRDLYRHAGNREAAQALEVWLGSARRADERIGGIRDASKSNVFSIIHPTPRQPGSPSTPYRLPWPAGQAIFCASHSDRLETPHRDRGHHALDFLLPQGTPVLAARGGVVRDLCAQHKVFANREFVTFILIDHDDGTWGRYYHLRGGSLRVRKGQRVRQGEILAESGRTGRCQSRHLHFEVLRKAPWRPSGPRIYSRWRSIPADFEETRRQQPDAIPGHWLISDNQRTP